MRDAALCPTPSHILMHAYILWIATLAYAIHVVEEFMFDWKTWATSVRKLGSR